MLRTAGNKSKRGYSHEIGKPSYARRKELDRKNRHKKEKEEN